MRAESTVAVGLGALLAAMALGGLGGLGGLGCSGSGDGPVTSPEAGPGDSSAAPEASVPPADAAPPVSDAGPDTAAPVEPPASRNFSHVGHAPESCTLGALLCAEWPSATDGVVTLYTSRETFGAKVFTRTFHVYVPAGVTASAPVVIALHGGNGSGASSLATLPLTKLAEARALGLAWRPNTALCKAMPGLESLTPDYRTPLDAPCAPPVERATSTVPFIVVYPDGLADPGTTDRRHWEDGRVPSPGWDTPDPNRDDVGFLEHVVEVLLADTSLAVDPRAVYLAGVSNGGMMTQRVAASAGRARYPGLARIAAYAALVSDLPEPLAPLAGATVPFGMALFHGTGIDTPDCTTPGCSSPVVTGDGRMPFGVSGGVHAVNSPDRGRVISGPDTIAAWRAALATSSGSAPSTTSTDLGFFTTGEVTTYGASPVAFESWVTVGGGHTFLSSRQDMNPITRAWAFLSTFRREASGALVRAPTAASGRY